MSQDWGEGADSGGQDKAASDGGPERFYMNKVYGRSLERARTLDERPGGQQEGGEFQRATIEPDSQGGHKVIVERSATVMRGGRHGQGAKRSEHSFAKPEDALQFLRGILDRGLPGEGKAGNHGDADGRSGTEDGADERHGSEIVELLEDALGGGGSRG